MTRKLFTTSPNSFTAFALFALVTVTLLSAAPTASAAGTPLYWPPSETFSCTWTLIVDGQPVSGTETLRFEDLTGNNYLRRGDLLQFVNGQPLNDPVIVTKPVPVYAPYYPNPVATDFELTKTSTPQVQCNLRVVVGQTQLTFSNCTNTAQISCSRVPW